MQQLSVAVGTVCLQGSPWTKEFDTEASVCLTQCSALTQLLSMCCVVSVACRLNHEGLHYTTETMIKLGNTGKHWESSLRPQS
jgi:hypothetical protein